MLYNIAAATLLLYAHSWYDTYCCSNKDCFKIDTKVERVEGGWKAVGHFFPDSIVRPSKDGEFHACILYNHPRCFYVPAMG